VTTAPASPAASDPASRSWADLISALLRREDLSAADAEWAMAGVMAGDATPVQLAGFLVALRAKGESPAEVSGLVSAMLAHAAPVDLAPSIGATVAGFGTIAVSVAVKCLSEQRLPARLNSASTGRLAATAAPSQACALRNILVCTPSLGGQNSAVVVSRFA